MIFLTQKAKARLNRYQKLLQRAVVRKLEEIASSPPVDQPTSQTFSFIDGMMLALGKSWYFQFLYRIDNEGRLIVGDVKVDEASGPH